MVDTNGVGGANSDGEETFLTVRLARIKVNTVGTTYYQPDWWELEVTLSLALGQGVICLNFAAW